MNKSAQQLDQDIARVLRKAIKAEREGHSFYIMAALTTKDAKGRQVFERFAQDELQHLQFLRQHYDSLNAAGELSPEAALEMLNPLNPVSPVFSDAIKARIKEAHLEMTALAIGIQLEIDSCEFYRSEAQQSDHPELQSMFKRLAEWEYDHYQTLLSQQKALSDLYWRESGLEPL